MRNGGSNEAPKIGDESLPEWISHYLIEDLLGEGSFGRVYLALDTRLDRKVAVKVLEKSAGSEFESTEHGFREARLMAGLDHPNIVPVYDVGKTENGDTFIVSKFIEGETLADRMINDARLEPEKGARILAAVSRALHHAHGYGLVHRDVKPGNIMIDGDDHPFLIDFGLALFRENLGRTRIRYIGTPPYMPPEQACGEGHRVTGRADVFSLGVILYEILTGSAPFEGATVAMMREIEFAEIVPPRQIRGSVPIELERICLGALSQRPGDRPDAAGRDTAFAEELEFFVRSDDTRKPNERVDVVPKGLHCFDEDDAGFFLDLLPGPRNRHGLPLSIARWKQRIEATDPDRTFPVGLIYGASGSGKSSLVRSGILPRLDSSILPIFVEAAANTEEQIVRAIHHRFPRLDGERDLRSLLRRLREGEGAPTGCKILLIIDQFEQFLHRNRGLEDAFIGGLRQCDGTRLLSLIIVRDDFWIGVSKLFGALEIEIDTGRNAAVVDRFDLRHAETVLIQFGRSYGKLPRDPTVPSRAQQRFIRRAVQEISEDGKVIPVRLSLFAEMFRNRPWTPAKLQSVDGISGLGLLYLEDCFGAESGGEAGRRHATAARRILETFLPDSTATMKGKSLSRDELREASGYETDSPEFDQLLAFLTGELHLLRPADGGGNGESPLYGLAHDYLVPSIRKWIDSKKLETRSGRAELKLREITDRWNISRNRRLLPSVAEWCRIRLFGVRGTWNPQEREVMRLGGFRALWRSVVFTAIAGGILVLALEFNWRLRANRLFSQIFVTRIENLEDQQNEAKRLRRWLEPMLRRQVAEEPLHSRNALQGRTMLLLMGERKQEAPVADSLFHLPPGEFGAIAKYLKPLSPATRDRLITEFENPRNLADRRLRAGLALFALGRAESDTVLSEIDGKYLSEGILKLDSADLADWSPVLAITREKSVRQLKQYIDGPKAENPPDEIVGNHRLHYLETETPGTLPNGARSTTIVTNIAGRLDFQIFNQEGQILVQSGEKELLGCESELDALRVSLRELSDPNLDPQETEQKVLCQIHGVLTLPRARQRAKAGVALVMLGRIGDALPLLGEMEFPDARSLFINDLRKNATSPVQETGSAVAPYPVVRDALVRALRKAQDREIRSGLLQALVPIDPKESNTALLSELAPIAEESLNSNWAVARSSARHLLDSLGGTIPAAPKPCSSRVGEWFTDSYGDEYVILPEFEGRLVAIGLTELTKATYRRHFDENFDMGSVRSPHRLCPISGVLPEQIYEYCNRLSRKEGLQTCYFQEGEDWFVFEDFLDRDGYRLPTLAEWKHASQGPARTTRHFGNSHDLLSDHAWFRDNTGGVLNRVAKKFPNPFGMFDTYGNADEYCHSDWQPIPSEQCRFLVAGGHFDSIRWHVSQFRRDSYTIGSAPSLSSSYRLVRTIPTQ